MSQAKVKVYPTSIIPTGGKIEPIRDHKMVASSVHVEVTHILLFFIVITFIFGGLWKAAQSKTEVRKPSAKKAKSFSQVTA